MTSFSHPDNGLFPSDFTLRPSLCSPVFRLPASLCSLRGSFFLPLLLLVFFFILPGPGSGLCADTKSPRKVMIISSYEPGHACGQPQIDGALQAMAAKGFKEGDNLKVERFFMDTLRSFSLPEQVDERARLALEQIKSFQPDLVLTIDDNAIRTVMPPLVDTGIPVVFSGMNHQPEAYNQGKKYMQSREKPGGNVTGIYEKLHIAKALEVMHAITGLHKAAVIVDASPTGSAVRIQVEKEMAGISSPVALEYFQVSTLEELKKKIEAINNDPDIGAIYPLLSTLKGMDNRNIASRELLSWLLANSKKAEMAITYSFAKIGMFGGAAVDFKAMGEQAGYKAAAILAGTPAGSLPIEDAGKQALVFNVERARQLGIAIPPDILNAADTLYETMEMKPISQPITLLIIQSYEKGTGCGSEIEAGLLEGLSHAGYLNGSRMNLAHYYMDTRNTHITPEAIINQAGLALEEIKRIKPQLIVLMDDNAFEHVLPPLIDGGIPVFFAGTNVPMEVYNRVHPFMDSRQHPGKNVTGITEEHSIQQSLHLIKNLFPTIKTAVTIYSDSTPFLQQMAEANERYIAEHQESLPVRFIQPERVTTLSGYQAAIKKYDDNPEVDLIYSFNPVSLIKDDGAVSPVEETINWMAHNQKKPDLTWMTSWVKAGALASAGIDVKDTGRRLADMIIKVLAGTNPGDIAIENPVKYSIALNLDRAKRLGLIIPVDILESAEMVYSEQTDDHFHK